MIAEFRVKNFYSIKQEQCLSFEPSADKFKKEEYCYPLKDGTHLLKIAMIYGANASGKSNILVALAYFRKLLVEVPKDKSEKIDITPFLLDDNSRKEKSEFSMIFYVEEEKYVLSVVLDELRIYSESLFYYPGTQPAKLYERKYNPQTDSSEVEFGSKLGLKKQSQTAIAGNTFNNCTVLAAFGRSNTELSKLNGIYDYFSHHFSNVLHPQSYLSGYIKRNLENDADHCLKKFLIKLLKASDFNISQIEIQKEEHHINPELETFIQSLPLSQKKKLGYLDNGKTVKTDLLFTHETHEGEFLLSEASESQGTIRFMGMAVILYNLLRNQKVISIDEIETSLHYELLSYLLKLFLANSSKKGSQLLLTTHDINLLSEDFIRRDVVWFTHKNEGGETQLTRLSSMGLHKNTSPYHAYKQGKLVDLPFMGSIYLDMDEICGEDKE